MTKFKIQVETKQIWETEIEAENIEGARKLRNDLYDMVTDGIEQLGEDLKFAFREPCKLAETFGGDDLSDRDITDLDAEAIPEADRAGISGVYTMQLSCPNCGDDMFIDDSEGRYGDIISGIDNEGFYIVTCDNCDKKFRQTSYKNY